MDRRTNAQVIEQAPDRRQPQRRPPTFDKYTQTPDRAAHSHTPPRPDTENHQEKVHLQRHHTRQAQPQQRTDPNTNRDDQIGVHGQNKTTAHKTAPDHSHSSPTGKQSAALLPSMRSFKSFDLQGRYYRQFHLGHAQACVLRRLQHSRRYGF